MASARVVENVQVRARLAAVATEKTAAAPPCRLTDSAACTNVMLLIRRIVHSPTSEVVLRSPRDECTKPVKQRERIAYSASSVQG